MTEYIPTPEDHELEAIIGRLFDRLEDAREGSAALRMVVRQLDGLRRSQQARRANHGRIRILGSGHSWLIIILSRQGAHDRHVAARIQRDLGTDDALLEHRLGR